MKEKTKIKVCMIVHQEYTIDTRVRSYANLLKELDAEIDVICVSNGNKRGGDQPVDQVRIYTIPLKRFASGVFYIFEYGIAFVFYTTWLFLLYFKNRYDIIHVHNMPDFLIFAALIPKLLGAKLILDIHDPMPEFFMSKFQERSDSRIVKFLKTQERFSTCLANEVITANPIFKERLSQRGIDNEKILVINNIPNPTIFNRQGIRSEAPKFSKKFTMIYPGTIASRYSLDIPIRALPKLSEEIPHIQFTIIGKNTQYADELAELAVQLGVSEYVIIIPCIPAEQVPQEIAKADIGVYTAIPDSHMSIAMPGKVLEFATMGIPIVASRLPILEAFFDDSSILFFTPGDVDEFSSHILKIYQDPSLQNKLIDSADTCFTLRYTWEDEFEKYTKLIQRLADD